MQTATRTFATRHLLPLIFLSIIAAVGSPVAAEEHNISPELAREIAREAYIWGYPLVLMDVTRRVLTNHEVASNRHNGDGWQQYQPGANGWQNAGGDRSGLDHDRAVRINGNWRSGGARSGGFHGGLAGGRALGGGRRR